jgi:hypothetical protein
MGKENCGPDQTHYCRHCLKHYQRSSTPLRDRKRRRPCTVKKISGHQYTILIDRGLCATDVHLLVIQRQEFGISRHAEHLTFMTVMLVMKRGE